jgi:hypothetical protein
MTNRKRKDVVVTHLPAPLLLGLTAAWAALPACFTETNSPSSTNCLDSQFITVHWGVDNGVDTTPMPCLSLSEMGLNVVLTTNASNPHVLPVAYHLSCAERAGRICGDGTACNSEGYTASGLPVGTAVVSGSLCAPSGVALYTVAWPTGPDPIPAETIPSCGSVTVSFPFRPYPVLPSQSSP